LNSLTTDRSYVKAVLGAQRSVSMDTIVWLYDVCIGARDLTTFDRRWRGGKDFLERQRGEVIIAG